MKEDCSKIVSSFCFRETSNEHLELPRQISTLSSEDLSYKYRPTLLDYERSNVTFLLNHEGHFRACRAKKLRFKIDDSASLTFDDVILISHRMQMYKIEEPEEVDVDEFLSDVLKSDELSPKSRKFISKGLFKKDKSLNTALSQKVARKNKHFGSPFIIIPCIGITKIQNNPS